MSGVSVDAGVGALRPPLLRPSRPLDFVRATGFQLLLAAFLTALASVGTETSPLGAQTVQGQLLERDSQAPVEGALVLLLDSEGRERGGYLTNTAGRFLLRAPGPGSYTLRAERIGFETVASEPFALTAGQIFGIQLLTERIPVELEALEVRGEQRCVLRPEEGLEISRIWEEARKALTVQEWTERQAVYQFRVASYQRDLDADGRTVEKEDRRVTTGFARNPIRSLPAEELMREGFIKRLAGGGFEYYGPDALVLLSDLFLDSHCFRLTTDPERPSLIGLRFEPIRRRNAFADVEGTLWLDRRTGELQLMEFGYTWAPYPEATGVARGRVEFQQLEDGAWIIRRWWIRVPRMVQDLSLAREGRSGIRVAGLHEAGGEVLDVSRPGEEVTARAEGGYVTGQVWDSTRHAPLRGAEVYLSGTQYATVSGPDGRFRLEGVPEGIFTAAFQHPRLDTLGIVLPGEPVEVGRGKVSYVVLSIPSWGTVLLASCRAQGLREDHSVLSGVVREEDTGEVLPGATVQLRWQEISGVAGHPTVREPEVTVQADADGRYTVCDLPPDRTLVARASFLGRRSDTVHVRLPRNSFQPLDLSVDLPPGFLSSRSEPLAVTGSHSVQGVQGTLREAGSGAWIRSAEVTLQRPSGAVVVRTQTDDRGFFRLVSPLPGRFILSVEALGFTDLPPQSVEILPGKLTVLQVEMAPEALDLEPIVVTAEPRAFHLEMQGFYERRNRGAGLFLTPEQLQERKPERITDLFWGLPGTRVVQSQGGEVGVYFRSGERPSSAGIKVCWPMVFVDRQLVLSGGFEEPARLNELARALDLAAVEVYNTPSGLPAEFNGPNAGCGVIVLWTRLGGGGD